MIKLFKEQYKELFKFGGNPSNKTINITTIIGGFLIVVIFYILTSTNSISTKIFPNPIDVITCIKGLFTEYNILSNAWYTIRLNLLGYVYALAIAIPFGFIIGIYPIASGLFQKYINAFRYVPIPVISGLFIYALGLGFTMKSSFLAVGILIYILPAVTNQVLSLQDPKNPSAYVKLQTGHTIGLSNWQKFKYIYWMYVMPNVYAEICSLTAISYTYVTIAENLNKEGGLGAMISIFQKQSRIPEVWATLLIIIIIGILQDFILKKLKYRLFPFTKNTKK